MSSHPRRARFWVEVVLAALASFLALLTLVTREWIEALTGLDPDGGSGSAEWLIVVACAVLAIMAAAMARREWRHIPQAV